MTKRKISRNFRGSFRIGPVSLSFITIILGFILCLLYLTQSNQIAVKGYNFSDLEKRKTELLEEKERMEIEAARLKSIQEIQKSAYDSKMVPTKKINYLTTTSSLASR